MTKIISIILIIAAIGLASYYLLTGRKLRREDAERARGWKRHLLLATAVVLAVAGSWGIAKSGAEEAGGAPAGREEQDAVAAAWAELRTAWREIDVYKADGLRAFEKEQKAKVKRHEKAVKKLVAAGALPQAMGSLLVQAFGSTTENALSRPVAREHRAARMCYDMVAGEFDSARFRATNELAKAATGLAELQASGKLAPEVARKAGGNIARSLQVFEAIEHATGMADRALAKAYAEGQPVDKPIPFEVKRAASVLTQLLWSNDLPALPTVPADPAGIFRRAWRDAYVYPDLKDQVRIDRIHQAKIAEHDKALGALVALGTVDADSAKIISAAFSSLANDAKLSIGPVVTCYKMSLAGHAGSRAVGELAKTAAALSDFAEADKLAPVVVEKVRAEMARELQIMSVSAKNNDSAVNKLAEAYIQGKPIEEPVPPEFAKAAETLARLLTEDSKN